MLTLRYRTSGNVEGLLTPSFKTERLSRGQGATASSRFHARTISSGRSVSRLVTGDRRGGKSLESKARRADSRRPEIATGYGAILINMRALERFLAERTVSWIVAFGLAATVTIAVLEVVLPAGSRIWVLHFLPIAFVTWFGRARWGALVAAVSLSPIVIWPAAFAGSAVGSAWAIELTVRGGTILLLLWLLRHGKSVAARTAEGVRIDSSTGLANARALFDLIAAERERADRYGRPFTVAYVGLENLPAVRSLSGASGVETLLGKVALEIRAGVRTVDYVARLRESEFAIVLPETGPHAARVVVERLRQALTELLRGEPRAVTFSVGVLTWRQSELSVEALHQRTCQLMYSARLEDDPIRHEVLELPISGGMLTEARHA